ncbi:MAG: hypothetical protein JXA39_00005, partial [Bacteroidales bacterium]|nr:hypothetical protein [Bacteroidales bacterium]
MKTLNLILLSLAVAAFSCTSPRFSASSEYDDVYYNPGTVEKQVEIAVHQPVAAEPQPVITAEQVQNVQPIPREQEAVTESPQEGELSDYEKYRMEMEAEMLGESYDMSGSEAAYYDQYQYYDSLNQGTQTKESPVIINNNYYYTDPNDYYYSSNLRRFSDEYYGWDYYDPYYTDLYFYTGRPFHWGINIGMGYPYWGMGYSYGYPYSSWGWGSYYDPWYSPFYYDYYPGYYGYSPGYYGYYPGYYGYPYSSFRSSYWYGYNSGYYQGYYNSSRYGSAMSNYRYGHLDNRYTYGYSRADAPSSRGSKGSTYTDPRYRSRSTGSTSTERSGQSTTVNPRNDNSVNPTVRTRTEADRGNQYGNDRPDNNLRDRGDLNRNQNPANRATQGPGNLERGGSDIRSNPARSTEPNTVRTTRPVTDGNTVRNYTATPQTRTYTPSYSKPRTSSTPAYNRSTPSRSTVPATKGTTYTPSRAGSTTYTRPGTSSGSSSYSAPSRSSSSYSAPSRSSSSYSAPS